MIQGYGLDEAAFRGDKYAEHSHSLGGCNDLLSITQPAIIEEIHEQFLAAGADIIETNTFNANRISMADYALEDATRDINLAAARVARRAADRVAEREGRLTWVAGSLGPTNKTASLSPDVNAPAARGVTFDELVAVYREQARALIDGGVDLLIAETSFDTLNMKAALFAIESVYADIGRRYPLISSVTITDRSGRTLSGQTVEAFYHSVMHVDLAAISINCALGADEMRPLRRGARARGAAAGGLLPKCRPAQRVWRVRRHARRNGFDHRRVCRRRLAQPRRRLLRHAPGAYPSHRRGCAPRLATVRSRSLTDPSALGSRGLDGDPRFKLPHDRRAHQRHRLAALSPPRPRGPPRGGPRRRPPASRERCQHSRCQHGRRDARRRRGDDTLFKSHRCRTRHQPHSHHARQLTVEHSRGGPQVLAGKRCRQFDQPKRG